MAKRAVEARSAARRAGSRRRGTFLVLPVRGAFGDNLSALRTEGCVIESDGFPRASSCATWLVTGAIPDHRKSRLGNPIHRPFLQLGLLGSGKLAQIRRISVTPDQIFLPWAAIEMLLCQPEKHVVTGLTPSLDRRKAPVQRLFRRKGGLEPENPCRARPPTIGTSFNFEPSAPHSTVRWVITSTGPPGSSDDRNEGAPRSVLNSRSGPDSAPVTAGRARRADVRIPSRRLTVSLRQEVGKQHGRWPRVEDAHSSGRPCGLRES